MRVKLCKIRQPVPTWFCVFINYFVYLLNISDTDYKLMYLNGLYIFMIWYDLMLKLTGLKERLFRVRLSKWKVYIFDVFFLLVDCDRNS